MRMNLTKEWCLAAAKREEGYTIAAGAAAPPLPRPDVTTTHETITGTGAPDFEAVDITISRDNKGKTYTGKGQTIPEAVSEAVKQIINDKASAEWLP